RRAGTPLGRGGVRDTTRQRRRADRDGRPGPAGGGGGRQPPGGRAGHGAGRAAAGTHEPGGEVPLHGERRQVMTNVIKAELTKLTRPRLPAFTAVAVILAALVAPTVTFLSAESGSGPGPE